MIYDDNLDDIYNLRVGSLNHFSRLRYNQVLTIHSVLLGAPSAVLILTINSV